MSRLRFSSFIYFFLTLGVLCFIGSAHTKPIQVLENIPGFISVYIRHGDEPLSEINPALADAFHENDNKNVVPVEQSLDFALIEDKNFGSESRDSPVIASKERRGVSHPQTPVQV